MAKTKAVIYIIKCLKMKMCITHGEQTREFNYVVNGFTQKIKNALIKLSISVTVKI